MNLIVSYFTKVQIATQPNHKNQQTETNTYISFAAQLLQHVLPHHGGRELDDEEEDVDGGCPRRRVLRLKGDLQRLRDKQYFFLTLIPIFQSNL